MRRISTISFIGMLALTMAGCGSGSEESSTPTPSAPQAVKTQPPAEAFDKPPMVDQNPQQSVISSAPALIQPTNPDKRATQVEKGRKDPFASINVPAAPIVPTTPKNPKPVPKVPNLPVPPQPVAVREVPPSPPVTIPQESFEPDLPPPQEPDLAQAITVSGVVQIGNETLAIVQVPNEGTSRYVREGQLLSNGQVLVKRIEVNQGPSPIVVLEQYGVEVAKAVGEEPVNQAQGDGGQDAPPTQDASFVPPPPPPPANQVSPGV